MVDGNEEVFTAIGEIGAGNDTTTAEDDGNTDDPSETTSEEESGKLSERQLDKLFQRPGDETGHFLASDTTRALSEEQKQEARRKRLRATQATEPQQTGEDKEEDVSLKPPGERKPGGLVDAIIADEKRRKRKIKSQI